MITILFIDDEDSLLHMCKTYLERSNDLKVDTARSIKDADDMMGETKYDAIVCDYQMPWRTGLELLKRLRMKKNTTPFILFTGKGNEDVAIDALNSGADYYLVKGGDPKAKFAELEHAVRDAVHERRWEKAMRLKNVAFEESTAAIIVTDPQFTISESNEAFLRMWAITTKNDVIGQPLGGYFQTCDVVDVIAASMNILGRWEGDFTAKKKNGSTFIAHGLVTALHGGSDKPTGFLFTLSDASKRKPSESEPAVPKPIDQFKLIAESCGDWLALVDSTGTIVYSSPSSQIIAGFAPEELKGNIMDQYVHPDDIPAVTERLKALFEKGESVPFEYRFRAKDGEYVQLETKVSVIDEGDDRPLKILFQNRDMAHRVFEPALPVEEAPLPVIVEEETEVHGVTAEAVEETNGDMFIPLPAPTETEPVLYGAAPQTTAEIKIERKDDLEKLVVLQDLITAELRKQGEPSTLDNLHQMDDIVASILAHARYAQEYAEIGGEPAWAPVQEICKNALSKVDMDLMHVQVLTNRLEMRADPLLEKVFLNMFEFASREGSKARKVWITYEAEGGLMKVLFEDNGVGVADDVKPLLFREGDDKYHGLALSKEILKATGIEIIENGIPGKGVRFEMSIPADSYRLKQ